MPDPPGGVGAEAVAARIVVFVNRAHQSDIALLDEVGEGQTLPHIALGDTHDEPRIGASEVLARALAVKDQPAQVAPPTIALLQNIGIIQSNAGFESALNALGQVNLIGGGQQRLLRHLPKIKSDGIVGRNGAYVSYRAVLQEVSILVLLRNELGDVLGLRIFRVLSELNPEFFQFKQEVSQGDPVFPVII